MLDALLPRYVESRIFAALLDVGRRRARRPAPGDEVGHRQRRDLIEQLTREANKARQAEITQEISEIVGGANALAETICREMSEHHMTATVENPAAAGRRRPRGTGRVARVIGPVVDVEFPAEQMPDIYNALHVDVTLGDETSGR